MEKEILDDIRSRIDDLQSQIDALRARLDSALSEPEDVPFTEPVDISLDDTFIEEIIPEAASGVSVETVSSGGSSSPDGFRSLRSLHPSQSGGWAPPSDVSEGGHAHRSQLPPDETAAGAAGGTACATEGPLTQETGPSAAAGSPEAKEEEMPVEPPKREVTLDYQWTKDIPGGPVSNIISGISLNDRVLLINTLFKEDPLLFQATIGDFNKMEYFADACDYVQEHFPDWNLSSETVYRLMMAVRRKLK